MPTSQRAILRALKLSAGLSTDELARQLRVTPGAVRHHLAVLARSGYVAHRPVADGRGRPAFVYHLTGEGHALFPSGYRDLALALARSLQARAPELLDAVIEDANVRRLDQAARLGSDSPSERLSAVVGSFEAEGYMPAVANSEQHAALTMHHCPIEAVARVEPRLCVAEQRYLEQVLGTSVEREAWRLEDGAPVCRYRLPLAQAGSQAEDFS